MINCRLQKPRNVIGGWCIIPKYMWKKTIIFSGMKPLSLMGQCTKDDSFVSYVFRVIYKWLLWFYFYSTMSFVYLDIWSRQTTFSLIRSLANIVALLKNIVRKRKVCHNETLIVIPLRSFKELIQTHNLEILLYSIERQIMI